MSLLGDIRAEIARRLNTIQGLHGIEGEVDRFKAPAAIVITPQLDYHKTFGRHGLVDLDLRVWVLVSSAMSLEAIRQMNEFSDPDGPLSIKRAIEGTERPNTLGGLVDDCVVMSFRPLNAEEAGGVDYWGGEFTLTISARKRGTDG